VLPVKTGLHLPAASFHQETSLNPVSTIFPASWSRERRSAVTIAIASFGMVLFLWSLAYPLSLLPSPIGPAATEFAEGARVTMALTIIAGPLGIVLGLLAALAKLSRLLPLRWLATGYIWIFRGTPLLVQVMFAFYGLPPEWKVSEFNAAILALALNVGAYNAEAIRAGILAVHKGQTEAARSLGLSPFQTFRDVVFPQSFRIALPPLVNNIVSLLKDSSLAYVIGVVELSNIANRVRSSSFEPVPVFITIAAIYLIMTSIMTQISGAIERQLDVERH
jgi:polar amino acid transport system permease protein